MEDVGRCANCGCTDYIVDYEAGDYICERCGCVDSRLYVSCAPYKEMYDRQGTRIQQAVVQESYRRGAYHESYADGMALERQSKRAKSAPYKPITYFAERISQWRMREPIIPADDWDIIDEIYQIFTGKHPYYSYSKCPDYYAPIWEPDRQLTKEDIRTLLWEADSRQPAAARRYFVTKYLVS